MILWKIVIQHLSQGVQRHLNTTYYYTHLAGTQNEKSEYDGNLGIRYAD